MLLFFQTKGNVGLWTSLKLLSNGFPAIAYMDNSHYAGGLKYIRSGDISGSGWEGPRLIVPGTDIVFFVDLMIHKQCVGEGVGAYASMALVSGQPAIAYHGLQSKDLFYIRADDVCLLLSFFIFFLLTFFPLSKANGDRWSATNVTVAANAGGGGIVLATRPSGAPVILFTRVSDGTLWFVASSDALGQAWGVPVQLVDVS